MKHALLLTGALLLAGAGSTVAQQQLSAPSHAGNDGKVVRPSAPAQRPLTPTQNPIRSESVSAIGYTIVDSLVNSFSFYSYGAHPFWYEPMTNTLVMIKRGSPAQSDADLYIRISGDLGATWGQPLGPLHDAATQGPGRYPSIYPINLTNTTNRDELYYFYTAPTLLSGDFGTFVSGVVDATGGALVPSVLSNPLATAETWGSDAHTGISPDRSAMVSVGAVSDNNLALRRFDVQQGTVTAAIPSTWASTVFVAPDDPTTRTSTFSGLDVDATSMYAGIFARYAAQEAEADGAFPAPGISTSTDNGQTWSAIEYMPRSILNDYVTGLGANPDSAHFGFSTNDFLVTGPNSASFILNLAESDEARGDDQIRQVVEVYRNNGTWGIRQVGTENGWFLLINGSEVGDTASQVDNEIQVAKTADGTRLLAKWTQLMSYISQTDIDDDGMAPDTFTTTDVHVASRLVSESAWGAQVNVTETPILDRQVWIPEIIPNDLANVPALSVQSRLDPSTDVTALDSLVNAQRVLVDRQQYVMSANFDASSAISGVRGPLATASFRLNAPMPNPSRDRSLVTFTLQKGGHVTIDVYTAAGQKVQTILDDARDAGNHAVAMNTTDLTSGTYYYTMRVNGEALTQSFTVVH